MKIRKITALCTSLLMCASVLAGCGSENEKSTEKKPKKTAGSSVSEKSSEDNKADEVQRKTEDNKASETQQETEEQEATTESEEDPELYEYYNLLNEEFEKGNISNRTFNMAQVGNFCKYKNKIIFLNNSPIHGGTIENATVFDTETKQSKTFDLNSGYGDGSVIFQNGFFYVITDNNELIKYDTDGNVVSKVTTDYCKLINIVSSDGKVIVRDNYLGYNDNADHYCLVPADFSGKKDIPLPQKDVGHGMTEKVERYEWICFDGDKAYAIAFISSKEYGIFCLDTNTLTWTQLKSLSDKLDYNFGKYILQYNGYESATFFNIETGEEIAQCEYPRTGSEILKGSSSCAGLSHHFRKEDENGDERWYTVRHPGNGEFADTDKCEPLGKENFSENAYNANVIRVIDDTYYAIIDEQGVFLRTYEKGEAEEETIYLFEKN